MWEFYFLIVMRFFYYAVLIKFKEAIIPEPTFNSLHSRESEKAGNISSYFCTASCRKRGRTLGVFVRFEVVVSGQKLGNGLLLH